MNIIEGSFRHRFFKSTDVEMAISEMGSLERLDLSHNEIERPPRLPASLISVNLSFNPQCQNLAGLAVSSLMNLRELVITNNSLTSTHGLSHLPSLEVLNLSDNSITKLSGCEMLSRLKVLILVHNDIKNVIALRCLSCNNSLESLDLRGNPVCEASNYATVKNMIGETLREMDGRLIKAKRFPTNKAAHSSAVGDNTYLHYATGNAVPPHVNEDINSSFSTRAKYTSIEDRASPEKFEVLRRNSMRTTKSRTPGMNKGGLGKGGGGGRGGSTRHAKISPVVKAAFGSSAGTVSSGVTPGSQSPPNAVSVGKGGGGYSAQYQAHGIQPSAVPSHSPGKQISVAGGLHMKPQYHHQYQGNRGSASPESEHDRDIGIGAGGGVLTMEEYRFNGDGLPRGKSGWKTHNTASWVRSNDSTASPRMGIHFAHGHSSYYQNTRTAGPGGASHLVRNFHMQKKSPVPWRNAPTVKPRPWKGALIYGTPGEAFFGNNGGGRFMTGDGTDEWVPVVGQEGRKMENDAEWVSPVTVAAYERDRHNVSNKNVYKASKEGMPMPLMPPEVQGPAELASLANSTSGGKVYSPSSRLGAKEQVGDDIYYSAAAIMPAWANQPGREGDECAMGSPSSLEYSLSRSMVEDRDGRNKDRYYEYPTSNGNGPIPPSPSATAALDRGVHRAQSQAPTRMPPPPNGDLRNTSSASDSTISRRSPPTRTHHYEYPTFSTYTKSPHRHMRGKASLSSEETYPAAGKTGEHDVHLSALERLAFSDNPIGGSIVQQHTYSEPKEHRRVQDISVSFISASDDDGTSKAMVGTAGGSIAVDGADVDQSALSIDTADIYVSKVFPPAAEAPVNEDSVTEGRKTEIPSTTSLPITSLQRALDAM